MPFKKEQYSNQKNINWKGDSATRGPILEWVKRRLGRPNKCEWCKCIDSKRFVWFSRSGEYKRDVADYVRICTSCHKKRTYLEKHPIKEKPFCLCGCGERVLWRNGKYLRGHNSKIHPTFLGKKHSQEWIEKMKKVNEETKPWLYCDRRDQKGKKNPNWNGGSSSENQLIRGSKQYDLWRRSVFERDNYTCQQCGEKKNLQVDHIKPFALYPELRFAIDNGRVLCKPCHMKTDTWGFRKEYKKKCQTLNTSPTIISGD